MPHNEGEPVRPPRGSLRAAEGLGKNLILALALPYRPPPGGKKVVGITPTFRTAGRVAEKRFGAAPRAGFLIIEEKGRGPRRISIRDLAQRGR